MTITVLQLAAPTAAAFAAGLTNAIAGGGTLITFPTLVACGLPSVGANVTSTVSLTAGYLGGAFAQRADLTPHRARLPVILAAGAVGGVAGALLLLGTQERVFRVIVPFLILFSCALLVAQDAIKRRVRGGGDGTRAMPRWLPVLVLLASIYGGYFGAGLGILLLAVLGLGLDGELRSINAVKQTISLVVNVIAAVLFATSGKVVWLLVPPMAIASYVGGHLGGKLASRLDARVLRALVAVGGTAIAVIMLVRGNR